MKSEQGNITDDLLVRYLLGAASDIEDMQVRQWISESGDNERYFNHFKLIWDESAGMAASSIVDADEAWMRFKQRTELAPKSIPFTRKYGWLKVAAVLLLLAGSGVAYYIIGQNNAPIVSSEVIQKPATTPAMENSKLIPAHPVVVNKEAEKTETSSKPKVTRKSEQKFVEKHQLSAIVSKNAVKTGTTTKGLLPKSKSKKEFVCNNTPCPIEICIIQSVKCRIDHAAPIATCSILEPDQSGQLKYKAFDKISKNCNATIDEIRITQVSTGETIVLNADSKPATAQEFFNYITGEKKGDIVAGVFHSDCNNNNDDCGLKFDNNYGNLFLQ